MENPSETQQRRLIRRVTNNVERLNEVVVQINKEFENIQPNLKQVKYLIKKDLFFYRTSASEGNEPGWPV